MWAKEVTGLGKASSGAQPQPAFTFTHKCKQVRFFVKRDRDFPAGDALTSQCVPLPDEADATAPDGFPQAPHGLLHVIRRTDSGDDVCRAVTRWTQKVRLP